MGACETKRNMPNEPKIILEGCIPTHGKPTTKEELEELYFYESAICKIKFKALINGQLLDGLGTGFFCEIYDKDIPFKKALFTNNHVLNKKSIEINNEIKFENSQKIQKILKITNNRKKFTNYIKGQLDYTCIEILDTDEIDNFFSN